MSLLAFLAGRASEAGGKASDPGAQQDPVAAAGAQVSEMLDNPAMPAPPEPMRKTSPAELITGVLADALMARATVMQGGIPGEGAFASRRRGEREAHARSLDEHKKAVEKAQVDAAKSAAERAEKRDFEVFQSNLDMAKSRENNEFISARATSARVATFMEELVKERGFELPPDFDLNKTTPNDAIRLAAAHYKNVGLNDEFANMAAAMKFMGGLGMEPAAGSVSSEGKPGLQFAPPKSKEEKEKDTGPKPLTAQQRVTAAMQLGEDVTALTDEQIQQKAAEYGKELKSFVKLPAKEGKDWRDAITVVTMAEQIKFMMQGGADGGAATFGFASDDDARAFRAKTDNLRDFITRERTGAAITKDEPELMKNFVITLGRLQKNNMAALNEIIDYYGRSHRMIESQLRIPEAQKRDMILKARGIDPMAPEGSISVEVEIPDGE